MTGWTKGIRVLPILLAFGFASGLSAGSVPSTLAVSPGDADRFAAIDRRCPTFSWGSVEGVSEWEIVVFAAPAALQASRGGAERVFTRRLPGAVTSWSASGKDCLAPGRYGWVVRGRSASEAGPWSRIRLFEVVTAAVGGGERGEILEAGRPTSMSPSGESKLPLEAISGAADVATGSTAGEGTTDGGAVSQLEAIAFSVDAAGNVIGSAFSGDGSGLTGVDASLLAGEGGDFYRGWANLTGVPPGFADGIDDNSDALAALLCEVGEIAVTTGSGWACGTDADSLAGLDCGPDEVPQHDGAGWVCTPLTVDQVGASIPLAPSHLRIGPEHRFPGMRRLSWNLESLAGVASFVVYQSEGPITEGNKMEARRQVTTSLHAAVDLFPNSGLQHFRVEARNVLGVAGPLSPELTIDTTSRLAFLAEYSLNDWAIYTVPAVPGASQIRVSDAFVEYQSFAWSPDGSRLAYSSDQGTYTGLHVVSASGGSPLRVDDPTVGFLWGWGWSWSPDGSQIAYRSDPSGIEYSWQLWVVPADGGAVVRVNDLSIQRVDEIPRPEWSPDGTRLLFGGANGADPVELFMAPASGGGDTKLSGAFPMDADGVLRAAWSPDGTRIAYTADQETAQTQELWVVSTSGGPPIKINPPISPPSDPLDAPGGVGRFVWSPDGTRIAYTADLESTGVSELYVAPASGGESIKLNEELVAGGDVGLVEWSPDGRLIAYTADLTVKGSSELRVVAATGGVGLRVSPTDPGGDPLEVSGLGFWSSDGRRLAFSASAPGSFGSAGRDLYLTTPEGMEWQVLNDPLVTDGGVSFFRWSPAGSRIAYQADQDTDELQELYVVGLNGGGATKMNEPFLMSVRGIGGFAWSPLGN